MKAVQWKLLLVIAVVLAGLTRIPVAPGRLSVEGVNLAFALDELDASDPQVRAPGFPFLVLGGRLLASFVPRAMWPRAEPAFLLVTVLSSAACLVVAFKLTSAMYSEWEARAA